VFKGGVASRYRKEVWQAGTERYRREYAKQSRKEVWQAGVERCMALRCRKGVWQAGIERYRRASRYKKVQMEVWQAGIERGYGKQVQKGTERSMASGSRKGMGGEKVPEGSVARRHYDRQEEGSVRSPGKELSEKTQKHEGLARRVIKESWKGYVAKKGGVDNCC
jgi:hypothetical protein